MNWVISNKFAVRLPDFPDTPRGSAEIQYIYVYYCTSLNGYDIQMGVFVYTHAHRTHL